MPIDPKHVLELANRLVGPARVLWRPTCAVAYLRLTMPCFISS